VAAPSWDFSPVMEQAAGRSMSDNALFGELATFFDDLPDVVRAEISFLMVALAGDQFLETETGQDYERVARGLFNAQSRFGRFGSLINAIAVFDVYFAADSRKRFRSLIQSVDPRPAGQTDTQSAARARCAERLAAIERARGEWAALRQACLTARAISAALM
jgi:hypothetical protein